MNMGNCNYFVGFAVSVRREREVRQPSTSAIAPVPSPTQYRKQIGASDDDKFNASTIGVTVSVILAAASPRMLIWHRKQ